MDIMKKLVKFDEKIEGWIVKNRLKYLFILLSLGIFMGVGAGYLLGIGIKQIIIISFVISGIFIVTDIVMH